MHDRVLVKEMLAGRERAFEEFFELYFPRLFRFARSRVSLRDDVAEEVAQATICRAITRLHTYRGEAALFTWLCTFCRHEISAYFKKNRVAQQRVDLIEDAPELRAALESAGIESGDPSAALQQAELARLARVALDHLSTRYASALEWKYFEGLSVREIADRLNLTPKAAESLLTRARDSFRDLFSALTDNSSSHRSLHTEPPS